MSRIAATFAELRKKRRTGLVAFLTVGFPSVAATLDLVPAIIESGADIVELGVPFSDPLAEGPTIQRSSQHALGQGVTVATCLETAATLRSRGITAPLVLMGYLNPFLAYGLTSFFREASSAGVDGVITVDATLDEADELRTAAVGTDIDLIPLVAPTTSEERLPQALGDAGGFVYCVSVA